MRAVAVSSALLLVAGLLLACSNRERSDAGAADAAWMDASRPEGGTDARDPDGGVMDSSADAPRDDAGAPDSAAIDGSLPDAPIDTSVPDAGGTDALLEVDASMCGSLGDSCGSGTGGCDVGQTCIPDVCVPAARMLCNRSDPRCPDSTPICMLCVGCTFAPCLTPAEQVCICLSPTGAASYEC